MVDVQLEITRGWNAMMMVVDDGDAEAQRRAIGIESVIQLWSFGGRYASLSAGRRCGPRSAAAAPDNNGLLIFSLPPLLHRPPVVVGDLCCRKT